MYEYWIKDHLGNVRVTYRDNNGDNIIDFSDQGSTSVHNYYTFGMEWINLADTLQPRNLYRYNGKEMIEEMNPEIVGIWGQILQSNTWNFSWGRRLGGEVPIVVALCLYSQ
ncbi:MAG: hypothetical protein IPJ13_28045 [Saprospiraceae bacterium]|nr:hypothetical protein [Saprospiraceae bacterium]